MVCPGLGDVCFPYGSRVPVSHNKASSGALPHENNPSPECSSPGSQFGSTEPTPEFPCLCLVLEQQLCKDRGVELLYQHHKGSCARGNSGNTHLWLKGWTNKRADSLFSGRGGVSLMIPGSVICLPGQGQGRGKGPPSFQSELFIWSIPVRTQPMKPSKRAGMTMMTLTHLVKSKSSCYSAKLFPTYSSHA